MMFIDSFWHPQLLPSTMYCAGQSRTSDDQKKAHPRFLRPICFESNRNWNRNRFRLIWNPGTLPNGRQLASVKDDADQAGYIVERTLARREAGMKLKHQAVLFRTSHHSARLEI